MDYDIPAIAVRHKEIFCPDIQINSSRVRRRPFEPMVLERIESDIRLLMVCSNTFGKGSKLAAGQEELIPVSNTRELRVPVACVAVGNHFRGASSPECSDGPAVTTPEKPTSARRSGNSIVTSTFPDSLRLDNVRAVDDGTIMWDMVLELASLELLFDYVNRGWAWDSIQDKMASKGCAPPSVFSLDEIPDMSNRDITNATRNIRLARGELLEYMDEYY